MHKSPLDAKHQKARAMALALTANTSLGPQRYERDLLTRFEREELTWDQVEGHLNARVHQLLYHSQITHRLSAAELQDLLAWSHHYNAAQGITGLLVRSGGRFVQVLEGDAVQVQDLFAHIQRDTRHQFVTCVREGLGLRQFAAWGMAYAVAPRAEVEQTILAIQTRWPWGVMVTHPGLQRLLNSFA